MESVSDHKQPENPTASAGEQETARAPQPPKPRADDDDDSDFDELDDVLDDFSKPKAQPPPAPTEPMTTGPTPPDFNEDAFLKQLEQDMAKMMGPGSGAPDSQGMHAAVNQEADAFTKQLEESGIPPGDFLKQLLADVMAEEGGNKDNSSGVPPSQPQPSSTSHPAQPQQPASAEGEEPSAESFNDAIQRTIHRMKESGDRATAAATSDDDVSDDMMAQLLKAVEAGAAGAGDDGDLTKMFMGMMEQLSNKEMLYEPMKELDGKFGPWLEKNKADGGDANVSAEDMQRYEIQARVVKQIVAKFEEEGYSDEDPKCREYVWQRMQEMQAAGSPPEELISNPLMEELGSASAGGVPDCPQQ
ncbi:Pex19 protein [Penicillium alfredii]|uniref:Pex19 protein n=1 Tax=Penicillium alfredii TaxID=1506179 RepID=A0A9W9FT31_9EURO|nr:Pex19 protein [Penicillium alfredii]KAJ5105895.1 Pex19 protein [Penicillium alfredii]